MGWRVLGPVEVDVGGRVLDIRRPQHRGVLALLLLNAGHVVPAARVIAALWGDTPPVSARTQVQVCVSKIRAALRHAGIGDALSSHAGGYLLTVGAGQLDLSAFDALVRRADGAPPAVASAALRDAVALWRGPALTGAAGAFVEPAAAALAERRLLAYEQLADVELALGRATPLVPTLRALADANPLRERLVGRLMLALAGSGEQSEALRLYTRTRDRLADELGIEPAAELTDIQVRVLRRQVGTPGASPHHPPSGTTPAATPTATPTATPAQLPMDVMGFVGRTAPLRDLDAVLAGAGGSATVVISAIGGTAGVGKTSLAVHWAHRVAGRFPDGQLYVNLRGFDIDGRAVGPGEALLGFLEALGVAPHTVPAAVDRRAALYRTLLAGRRVLVVLDNARDTDQVRPLLPGTAGCLALVTSRNRLPGLIAAAGARPLTLRLLSGPEAHQLLAQRVGPARIAAEPAAAARIVQRCAGLPLALAIAGARAAVHPDRPLAALAAELETFRGGLEALDAGEPGTDVRSVFSWSYRSLDPNAARLFRLLGLHAGPDIALPAVASLAGSTQPAVRAPLGALLRAHLIAEHQPGRYTFHDLLREYAAERCDDVDPAADRDAAIHRLLDHYLHSAHGADLLLDPHRLVHPIDPPRPHGCAVVLEHGDHLGATAWLTAEHRVLLAAVELAAATGFDGHAWRLAATLITFLDRRGHWNDLAAAQRTALAAARRDADPIGQANAYRGLAIVDTWLGRHDEALAQYRRCLAVCRVLGDHAGRANTHIGMSWVLARQGRHRDALAHTERALALFRAAGHRVGQAKALNNIGWLHAHLGEHEQALRCCRQALAVHELTGNRHGAALTWDSLGYTYHRQGAHGQAAACYEKALVLHRDLGDRYDEAEVLTNLGDTHDATGDPASARLAWQRALRIYQELRHPDTHQLRARLARQTG